MKGKGRPDPKGPLGLGSQIAVSHKQSWKSARSMGVLHRIQVTQGVPACPPVSQGTGAQVWTRTPQGRTEFKSHSRLWLTFLPPLHLSPSQFYAVLSRSVVSDSLQPFGL